MTIARVLKPYRGPDGRFHVPAEVSLPGDASVHLIVSAPEQAIQSALQFATQRLGRAISQNAVAGTAMQPPVPPSAIVAGYDDYDHYGHYDEVAGWWSNLGRNIGKAFSSGIGRKIVKSVVSYVPYVGPLIAQSGLADMALDAAGKASNKRKKRRRGKTRRRPMLRGRAESDRQAMVRRKRRAARAAALAAKRKRSAGRLGRRALSGRSLRGSSRSARLAALRKRYRRRRMQRQMQQRRDERRSRPERRHWDDESLRTERARRPSRRERQERKHSRKRSAARFRDLLSERHGVQGGQHVLRLAKAARLLQRATAGDRGAMRSIDRMMHRAASGDKRSQIASGYIGALAQSSDPLANIIKDLGSRRAGYRPALKSE